MWKSGFKEHEWVKQMTIFLAFYVVGGGIGVLIGLRFLLPFAYLDVKNAWGFIEALKFIGYQLIRILMLSCVAFFVSWISVGYLIFQYQDFKTELEYKRRYWSNWTFFLTEIINTWWRRSLTLSRSPQERKSIFSCQRTKRSWILFQKIISTT